MERVRGIECTETTRASNELCSFTAGLMEPSGDPSRSLSLSPRGKGSPAP